MQRKWLWSLFLFFYLISLSSLSYSHETYIAKVEPSQVVKLNFNQACLLSKLSLTSSSNWYAAATLTITNNCTSAQVLNKAVVSFQSNSLNITSMWGGPNSSSNFTYRGNIASTVLNITNDPLMIGKTLILNFGINLTGTSFDLTNANNSLTLVTNTPNPSLGVIQLTVDPQGVSGVTSSSEIRITGPGLAQPYVILNSSWTTPTTFNVTGLAYGTYAISALPIANYTGVATPASVTLSSSTPVPVIVSYQLAAATGALQVNLGPAPMQGIDTSVNASLKDNTSGQTQPFTVAFNGNRLIPNLPVGHNYTVTFPQVTNGTQFSNPNPIENPIILQNRTTPLNVSYQVAQPIPSVSVSFNVSGLANNILGTLSIVDSHGNKYTKTNFGNGITTQSLPVNETFSVSATAPGMYTNINPSSFTLSAGAPAPTVVVQFIPNPPVASTANFFAYSDSGMQTNHNGLVPPKGANMVEAFILYDPFKGRSKLWAVDEGDAIAEIIRNTPKTFGSVGGANGPYPWDYQTVAKAVADIEALVDYFHFIGIDFDVEGAALETPNVQDWVAQAVLQLRRDRPNLILTLTVPDPVIGFTSGTMAILRKTLAANNNKMVFNWVNKMNFDENGLGNGCTQTDTNMNNNCLVLSATYGAQQLATLLGITQTQAYQYLGETFMVPVDDQGHPLSLSLANQVATTIKNFGVTHMGYWRLQNDPDLAYGNMFTHVLGLS